MEILGLKENNNGRKCHMHSTCGEQVVPGCMLLLKPTIIQNTSNQAEYAIAASIMVEGVEKCRVGFVGREFHIFRSRYEHKLVEVVEVLEKSSNTAHRRRSHANRGIATAFCLN